MINRDKLKLEIVKAEKGDISARAVVRRVLEPRETDSVDEILEKITIFIRLIFLASLKFSDAPFHKEIDRTYAEQIHAYLTTGKPKYKGIIIIGYRESAKTSRVKFNEAYLASFIPQILDYTNVVSEDGSSSDQFNMDMFNTLGFSKVSQYVPDLIALEQRKKKESQTMSRFTTTSGVTYSSSSVRKSKRGAVKMDIDDETGEVDTKRPKKVIFDDIENETTLLSKAATEQISVVMQATIDGLDQLSGFWMLLGNYLSLRGNVAKFLSKYREDASVKKIMIPILDEHGNPTWEDKYTRTDSEEVEFAAQGIAKSSVETIQRNSENFQIEYMNNPKRSLVYFGDECFVGVNDEELIPEHSRNEQGYLEIDEPEPTQIYALSADSARGINKDESAFTVIKISGIRYEEVANFKSKTIKPEKFAGFSANIARYYNNAVVIPENNYPGNEFIAFLLPIYQHIYIEETDREGNPIYGINTNLKTKPEMFLHAKRVLRDRLFTIRSRALYNQFSEYPDKDIHEVHSRDGTGGHFDLLMSAVIGLWKASAQNREEEINRKMDEKLRRSVDSIFLEDGSHL